MMTTLVTLAEAATYLGVSKATLRNWDKEGKLKAHRHPINRYRAYDLEELRRLRPQASLLDEPEPSSPRQPAVVTDSRSVKRVVARLHAILRDTDGDSSIVQRFDELTKLLYPEACRRQRWHAQRFRKDAWGDDHAVRKAAARCLSG
ncbi:MAG: helix-turn-helix domain-containing protein [Betaproteobacteria bacterium]|nr:helix-turn-helix domain-containing protein [Betaproteobacteria bacterium]